MSLAGKYTCESRGRGWGRVQRPAFHMPHAPLVFCAPPPLSYSEQLVGDGNVGPGRHACHLLPQSQRPGEPGQGPVARAHFAGEGGQAPECQGVGPGKLTLARRLGPSSCRWAWSSRPARGCRTPASPSGTSWTYPRPTSSSKVQASVSLLGNRWASGDSAPSGCVGRRTWWRVACWHLWGPANSVETLGAHHAHSSPGH